ncbi:MAG: hypothetical protein K2H01_12580 [Ruminococcus sp.]|nr:hypothetical protein [Ruminococcus sp.]
MIKLTAQDKFIDTKEIKYLLTQGEKNSDMIQFLLKTKNNDVDISECTFILRTVASEGSMSETALAKAVTGENIALLWKIPDTATAVAGMLRMELIGIKENTTIIKFKMPPVYVKEAVMGSNVPIPDIVDEKLAQMNSILNQTTEIAGNLSVDTNIIQEIENARKGVFSNYNYNTLGQRLAAELSSCVQTSALETYLNSVLMQAQNTGVGRFWKNSSGEICGEIFGDYQNNKAYCLYSHAEGTGTVAGSQYQHVGGAFNIIDTSNKYARIIGNGTSQDTRSNALTLDWDGNLWTAGDVTATDSFGNSVSLCELQNSLYTSQNYITELQKYLGMIKGKNLLKNTAATTTESGVTFTRNSDGSITCNGTATQAIQFLIGEVNVSENTDYIISGCPTGGNPNKYFLLANMSNIGNLDFGSGTTFNSRAYSNIKVNIYIREGQTVNNLTFYPMLRYASITDNTYTPYKDDLQTQINELKAQVAALTAMSNS